MTANAGMSSRLSCAPRWGTPRTLIRPTLGPKVAAVARMLGQPLMPWQQHVADVALEVDPETGKLAYNDVTLLVGRQEGKTALVLPVLTHRALGFTRMAQRILYTTQTADKAREKWRDNYVGKLQSSPLAEMVADVRLRLNFEQCLFTTGSTFVPVTPSAKSGGTGDSIDLAFIDEAWCHEDSGIEQAMSPAMVTRDQPQLWIVSTAKRQPTGTPHNPKFAAYLRARIAAGRARVEAGVTSKTAYFEWSAPEDADPADPVTWWGCLPAMGHTVSEDAMRTQFERMELGDFCAEFLGWWPSDAQLRWQIIPQLTWGNLADRWAKPGYPIAFAIDTSPDFGMTSISAAGPTSVGDLKAWAVEVVEHGGGTGWAVPRMVELYERWRPCAVAIAQNGPASSLIDPLENAGVPVRRELKVADGKRTALMSMPDIARAYGMFHRAAMEIGPAEDGEPESSRWPLRHAAQPELDTAVSLAWKRRVGTQTVWDWGSPGDVSPVVSSSAALWAAQLFGPAHREADYDVLRSIY